MKNIYTYIIAIVVLIGIPFSVFANPVNVNRQPGFLESLYPGDYFKAQYFVATSTTATSTFPIASFGQKTFATSTEFKSANSITAWGDSLTAGQGALAYTDWLANYLSHSYYISNYGHGGETSTQVKNRFLANSLRQNDFTVIWAGYNGGAGVGDVQTMVAAKQSPKYYLVFLPDYLKAGSGSTTPAYTAAKAARVDFETAFPNNYFDVWTWMRQTCNPIGGSNVTNWYASTTLDQDDCRDMVIPRSLDLDGVHLTTEASKIVAQGVAARINSLSPQDLEKPLSIRSMDDFRNVLPIQVSTSTENLNIGAPSEGFQNITGTQNIGIYNKIGLYNALTTGSRNVCIGENVCDIITTGSDNYILGNNSGPSTGATANVAIGTGAGGNETGNGNVNLGWYSGLLNTTAELNTGIGYYSLYSTGAGFGNTGNGAYSGLNSTGDYNTFLGYTSGGHGTAFSNTTGARNTYLGYNTAPETSAASAYTDSFVIGQNGRLNCSFCGILGGIGVNAVKVGVGTSSPYADLSVHAFANATYNNTLFAIASSTAAATSTLMVVKADGTVGIGSTSPAALLSVSRLGGATGPTAFFAINDESTSGFTIYQGINNFMLFRVNGLNNEVNIQEYGGITTFGGKVGIGTTSPYAALSVVGEAVARNFTATSTTATSTFAGPVAGLIETFCFALSDETTPLVTSSTTVTWRAPFEGTLINVRTSVASTSIGADILVNLKESGASVFSTRVSIDANEKTSRSAASAHAFSDTAFADDAEMTWEIDRVGTTQAGTGLKACAYLKRI